MGQPKLTLLVATYPWQDGVKVKIIQLDSEESCESSTVKVVVDEIQQRTLQLVLGALEHQNPLRRVTNIFHPKKETSSELQNGF